MVHALSHDVDLHQDILTDRLTTTAFLEYLGCILGSCDLLRAPFNDGKLPSV